MRRRQELAGQLQDDPLQSLEWTRILLLSSFSMNRDLEYECLKACQLDCLGVSNNGGGDTAHRV